MQTIKIALRNVDEAAIQSVLNFVLRKLEDEGLGASIVSAEIENDDVFQG